MAALDSAEDKPPVPTWRAPAWRRVTSLTLTLLAVGLAIAFVAAGPPRPVTYDLRLPLLVLAGGALVTATQWRRKVCVTPDEVLLRTLFRTRRIPLRTVARAETHRGRVIVRMWNGRKAVIRAAADPPAADELAHAVVTAAGPAAYLAAGPPPTPVPMATPWLITLSTAAVAILTARGFAADPALVTAALVAATALSCAALGLGWLQQRHERIGEPES